ncbi:AAA family ATPase [Oceanobacillus timonensis]|uniref:AAA family ATPase n=1 Tax=Oceanobacillus timonensis TaxID=1926285 RepID=UPI0009BA7050|nr:AAA family ATPase [Oceanobacillus timonensis]
MIIWLNGAFGSGKTTSAYELKRRLPNSFVYDPENIGYFIRENIPKELHKSNFQDHAHWRTFNYEMLKYIADTYNGTIIVPMTIFNPQYYEEIIQKLIDNGHSVRHYILYADKSTLLKRLNKRLERGETWTKSQIDRCIQVFNTEITEEKIITDNKRMDTVVDEIAKRSKISLLPDKRTSLKKWVDRVIVLMKHIRLK